MEPSLPNTLKEAADPIGLEPNDRPAALHLEGVLDSISDAFVAVDWTWRFQYVNNAFLDLVRPLCASPDQLLGSSLWSLFSLPQASEFAAFCESRRQQHTPGEFELQYAPLPGWHEVRAYSADGHLCLVFKDVSARKQLEAQAARRMERSGLLSQMLGQLLEASDPERLIRELFPRVASQLEVDTYFNFMVDPSGDWLTLHSSAGISDEQARGIQRLEFGQAICGTVAKQCHAMVVTDIQQSDNPKAALVRSFGIQAYACNPLVVGGRLLGTLSFASRVRTSFDEDELELFRTVSQYAAVAMDRLRHAEELSRNEVDLREAKEAAEAANQSKDKFLAVLSHELRTPLTPVLMTASAYAYDPSASERIKADMQMICRNVELETRIIDDLLDLSRIISGKLNLRSENVDLNQLARQVCEMCLPQIHEKHLRLRQHYTSEAAHVQADSSRLQQVLWNIVKNAVKFTPEGGEIEVESRIVDDEVEIVIRDTGIGIPGDILPRIFDAFAQGDEKITRQFGGLGLGLAISKALVDLQNGSLRADSAGEGQGSCFTIRLPRVAAFVSRTPERPLSAKAAEIPLRILLAEDHADTALMLSRYLALSGFVVETAGSLAEALTLAQAQPFDLLLSDIGLPDGRGYDLIPQVQALQPQLVGIAMSGYGMEEDIRRSLEAGFSEHLVKPVNIGILSQAIRRVAKRRVA